MKIYFKIICLTLLSLGASCDDDNLEITTTITVKNTTSHRVALDFYGVSLMDNTRLIIVLDSGATYNYSRRIFRKSDFPEYRKIWADSAHVLFNDSLAIAFGPSGDYRCAFDTLNINPLCEANWHFTKNPGYTNTRFEVGGKMYSLAE